MSSKWAMEGIGLRGNFVTYTLTTVLLGQRNQV
jgi:hypothetical protein